ncbi:uncharacterized protein PG998_001497 [Apiospora kogelbergensis]|uniref:uncharacterized protein n=1 Tax=Apiospora kogelbergensis TaxID=1337665 RepID=UPI00312DC28B
MSILSDKASMAPSANAHGAMRKYYPEWTEQFLVAPEEAAHQGVSQEGSNILPGSGREYQEFLLSSNWVLRPDGLQEFFVEYGKLSLKSQITWDATLGCFRVRSRLDEGAILMGAVRDILDRIVQPEINQIPKSEGSGAFDGKSSTKIQHVSEWRAATIGVDELKAYDKFAYPRALMQMGYQGTWHIPTGQINAGVTMTSIIPTNRLLDELRKSSGCAVLVGMDGKSLQIGGATENNVEIAKKKIDTLSRYYDLSSSSDATGRHVLYSESQATYMAELRYIAHLNEGLLTTIFLDRTKGAPKNIYGRIFSKGSVVSKSLYSNASGGYLAAPQPITAAIEKSKATSAFAPFKGYKYAAKASSWVPDESSSTGSRPSSAVQGDLSGVNPQAAPNVAQWAKKTALVNANIKTAPMSMDKPSQPLWGGAHEIDPAGTHSSVTASPETANASSCQTKAPARDLLSSPVRTQKSSGSSKPDPLVSSDGDIDLIAFSPQKDNSDAFISWAMKPLLPSPRVVDGEQKSREFHSTMEQQASSKKLTSAEAQRFSTQKLDPTPEVIGKVSNKLAKILEPLRIFQGTVSLKAELGRFIFTTMSPAHISLPGDGNHQRRHRSPDEMEMMLERHSNTLLFTNIISLSGGDMNYIADLGEPVDALSRIWTPSRKSVIYEFLCDTSTVGKRATHCFDVNVNAEDFSYQVRPSVKESRKGAVFMHCLDRTFDIQFTVDTAPHLTEHCKYFADELQDSLTVTITKNGTGVPYLTFINHGDWRAKVRSARIRRTSVYFSTKHQCELEITQVIEMGVSPESVVGKVTKLVVEESEGNPVNGIFPVFYEACIKSTVAERAFAENRNLNFAEEAEWTGKDLKAAGVFKDLILSATDLVKQMDGIGLWCDNKQTATLHGKPPMSTAEVESEKKARDDEKLSFW